MCTHTRARTHAHTHTHTHTHTQVRGDVGVRTGCDPVPALPFVLRYELHIMQVIIYIYIYIYIYIHTNIYILRYEVQGISYCITYMNWRSLRCHHLKLLMHEALSY